MTSQIYQIEILMYHSISDAGGPTSIPKSVFDRQIAALKSAGYRVVGLEDIPAWIKGDTEFTAKTAVITFDDGFADFREAAWPALEQHGFTGVVFLPTEHIGRTERWDGANAPARALMKWADVRMLARDGVGFGSHSMSHARLPDLTDERLEAELALSKARLEDELGCAVRTVAPPYGATSNRVRDALARHYDVAVSTKFDRVKKTADLFDLPRIEMHYFRNISVWRRYLDGNAEFYLRARQFARKLRAMTPLG